MGPEFTLHLLRTPPLGRVLNRTVGLHFIIFKLREDISEEGPAPLVTKFVQLTGTWLYQFLIYGQGNATYTWWLVAGMPVAGHLPCAVATQTIIADSKIDPSGKWDSKLAGVGAFDFRSRTGDWLSWVTFFLQFCQAYTGIRAIPDLSHVPEGPVQIGTEYTFGQQCVCVCVHEGVHLKFKPYRPHHDRIATACVIAQQYSSCTSVTLRFHSRKVKLDVLLKQLLQFFFF